MFQLDQSFRFITTRGPHDAKDRETRRSVQSHAVRQALQNKRKQEKALNQNFRSSPSKDDPFRPGRAEQDTQHQVNIVSSISILSGVIPSLEKGSIRMLRLDALMSQCKLPTKIPRDTSDGFT